jgi:urease accessory protein
MLVSNGIIGAFDAARHSTNTLDFIDVPWAEASKRRLRRRTKGGLDFAVSMEQSQYLFHGAVLFSNEDHTIVVSRPEERALVVDLGQTSPIPNIVRQAALIGHAFGNQHIPIEIDGCRILVPMLSSEGLMAKTIVELGLGELILRFDHVRLGAIRPLVVNRHSHE